MKSNFINLNLGFCAVLIATLSLSGYNALAANGPDLSVSITDGLDAVNPGAQMLYTITVTNIGNASATSAALSTNIPTPSSFVSSTSGGAVQSGKVVFPSFTLAAGANKTFQFILGLPNPLPANPPATLAVTATVVLAADVNAANNSATDTDTLNPVAPYGDLAIEITDGLTDIQPGAQMLYTMTISNIGNITMSSILVKATVPSNSTFVSANNSGAVQNGFVVYPLFTLAAGASVTRQFTLSLNNPQPVPTPTLFSVAANVSSPDGECNPPNNDAVDCDNIKPLMPCPDVAIVKTATDDCKLPGSQFTYTLTISTLNTVAVTGVVVTDPLPAGLSFVSASNGGTFANGTVTFPAFALAGNSSVTRSITVLVSSLINVSSISNTASVTDDGLNGMDSNTANNKSTRVDCINLNKPDVAIVKSATDDCKVPGSQFTYTLTISTLTQIAVTGVVVTDPLPAGVSFVSASNGGTVANGTVSFPVFALAGNSSVTRTVTVLVASNINVASITNTASVTDDGTHGADSNPANNTSTRVDCINLNKPDLAIVKSATDDCKVPGSQFTYTLTISTLTQIAVTGVVVTDPLPAGVSFVSASNGGTVANGTVTFPAFALAGNSSVTRTVTVLVASNINVASITNTASVTDDGTHGADSNPANNTSTRVDCIKLNQPDVAIVKTATDDCKVPGSQFSYTLTISTLNAVAVTGVVVTDPLPAGVSFVSASDSGTFANGTVTFPAFALAGNSSVARTVTVLVASNINVASISNTASVTDDGTHGADSNTANNTSTRVDCIKLTQPDIAIVKTATDDCKVPGSQFTYTLTISTLNAVAVTGVVVTDPLPAGVSFVSASDSGTFANGTVTFPAFALAGNSSVTRTITVLVSTSINVTSISNTASVTDDGTHGADSNTANNKSTRVDCVVILNLPDVAIVKSAPDNCMVRGTQFTYTLTISTKNAVAVTGVVVTDPLPATLTFVSASNGGTFANGTVTFPAFALAGNSSVTRSIVVLVPAALPNSVTSITNTASVKDDGTHGDDSNKTNNVSPKVVCIKPPPVDLTVVVSDDVDCISAGKELVLTYKACNVGATTATGVVISGTIPANTTYVSSSNGGTLNNGVVTFPVIASMAAGDCVTRTISVKVGSPLPAGVTSVTTTATVTDDKANGDDATPSNNTATDTVPICPAPDLQITQDSSPVCFAPGAQITYTLLVKNNVLSAVSGVVVTDKLPDNVDYVSSSNGGVFANGVVTFPAFNLAANVTAIRTITVQVNDGLTAAVTLSNVASVTDDGSYGADTDTSNNSATRTDCTNVNPPCTTPPTILSGPNATPAPIIAGVEETFSVVATDNGTGQGVTVSWDWGDGTPSGTGATVKHTYAAPGSYTVKVVVANACGAVGATLQAATGNRPNPFVCNLLRAPLNLKKSNSDSLTFVAQIDFPTEFKPAGRQISFNFSNWSFTATLDKKGRFKDARHSIAVKAFGKSALVTMKVVKESLKTPLTPGLSSSALNATIPNQRYLISFGPDNFGQNLDINFTSDSVKGLIYK